jgi:uncharacterized delta-60 repeat protein
MTVDKSGNVYVTGESIGTTNPDFDYATVKYNSAGEQQWVARYDGPWHLDDEPAAIAIDGSGNVYVTGTIQVSQFAYDYGTIKYNSIGQQQWVAQFHGPGDLGGGAAAMAVDQIGNVYVTGTVYDESGSRAYATIKYNSNGQQQWVATYSSPEHLGHSATAIAINDVGEVWVTGQCDTTGGAIDYVTIKYNAAGQQQWIARYDNPAHGYNYARAIAVDSSGNVCVTGMSDGFNNAMDYATIKYNSAGQQLWVARYNGAADGFNDAHAIAIDRSGNVYVTGQSRGVGTGFDFATIKYNFAGQQLWVARYDANSGDDAGRAIAVDGSGNVYVTGESVAVQPFSDYATVKYDSAGREQWTARYHGPGHYHDWSTAIAIDALDNVYVTGSSTGSAGDRDFATIKYTQGTGPTPTPTASPTPTPTPTPCTGRCEPTPRPRGTPHSRP